MARCGAAERFPDFSRQLAIWNGKFSGERPMLDAAGRPIEARELPVAERIDAILLWSALPGRAAITGAPISISSTAVPPRRAIGYGSRRRSRAGRPFVRLGEWLETHAARFGFFRPFRGVLSGVQAEPWHYSFAPVAENARRALTPAVLRAAIAAAPLLGKEQCWNGSTNCMTAMSRPSTGLEAA